MKRKIIKISLLCLFMMLFFTKAASASDFTISSDTDLASLSLGAGDCIIVPDDSKIKLYSSVSNAVYNISICCGENVSLEIENVNITSPSCAVSFEDGSSFLNFCGTNTLRSSSTYPGVMVCYPTELTISGSGTLNAYGGTRGAGIGGSENIGAVTNEAMRINAGTINIISGTINAYGGSSAAGIGGGEQGNGTIINISGGTIYAKPGTNAAGIGGGAVAKSGIINISGGDITANGDNSGAAIGSGSLMAVEQINISGGTIRAYGGTYSAGIGGGSQSPGGEINISGGNITARGNYRGTAIGAGYYADCGTIKITGGDIYAYTMSGTYAAAIGTSQFGLGGDIIIEGGNIYANGGSYGGAGIGSGRQSSSTPVTSITISGGTIEAYSRYAAAIGGGRFVSDAGEITITGGLIAAYASASGYNDVGASTSSYSGSINISGDAALFLKTNLSSDVITSTHSHFTDETIAGNMAYEYSVPASWTGTAYAWLPTLLVTYEAGENGNICDSKASVSPSKPTEKVLKGRSPKDAPDTLPNENYVFTGWSDGKITSKDLKSFIIKSPTTLVAVFAPIGADTVDIDIENATLELDDLDTANDTIELTAAVSPENAANKNIIWQSSDDAIATVDSTGFVTAVSSGIATITTTTEDGGHTDTCTITVLQHVTEVTLDKEKETYYRNTSDILTCSVGPYDAFDKSVTWYCDKPQVVSYTVLDDHSIQFTALSPGTAHIYVQTNDMSYQDMFQIHVKNPENTSKMKAGLSCELLNSSKKAMKGYTFTLYSDPISAATNVSGRVSFDDIAYDYHTLVIEDDMGNEVRRYDLTFSTGNKTGYSILGSDIALTYTGNTKNIHLIFELNDTGNDAPLSYAGFTAANPETGDDSTWLETIISIILNLFKN
ncbi:MAG: Ig-like domain-containing protein [Eubacteriales bacterium]